MILQYASRSSAWRYDFCLFRNSGQNQPLFSRTKSSFASNLSLINTGLEFKVEFSQSLRSGSFASRIFLFLCADQQGPELLLPIFSSRNSDGGGLFWQSMPFHTVELITVFFFSFRVCRWPFDHGQRLGVFMVVLLCLKQLTVFMQWPLFDLGRVSASCRRAFRF